MPNRLWLAGVFIGCGTSLAACGGATGEEPSQSGGRVSPGQECRELGARASADDGCNTCTCTEDGWACTEMACGPVCTEGATKPLGDGCNTCSCMNGQWGCTTMACDQDGGAICTPGETRSSDDGCNSCTCTDGGQWACTKRACVDAGVGVACGARAGDTCSSGEYCAYVEGAYCGAGDAEATCQKRPAACDTMYDPVCGCDGQTHSNDCVAAMAGTGVLHAGPCSR